jgi:carboxypeptidase Taq
MTDQNMNTKQQAAWSSLNERMREISLFNGAQALLHWDQQTYMPSGAAALRGAQNASMASLTHTRFTAPEVGEWLNILGEADLDAFHTASLHNLKRERDREVRLPTALVMAFAKAETDGFTRWMAARNAEDYSLFAPALQILLDLSKAKVACLKTEEACGYDVLLDQFDPGVTTAYLEPVFERMSGAINTLLDELATRPTPAPLGGTWGVAQQRALSEDVVASLGFDLQTGRLDEAQHPFTIKMSPHDVRLTTHYYEDDLINGLGGTIHETGHGLYEQGLPKDWFATGVGEAASLGLHESQSRFWENFIGRSLPFCTWLSGRIQQHFGTTVDPMRLFQASNRVERSLVRTMADETTYNLHIIVRFQLEKALIDGDLGVADAEKAWNDAYGRIVGVQATKPTDGILQDMHWSGGAFGYFPSYSLGNLYAASLGAKIQEEIPTLWTQVESGNFEEVLAWLRKNIHHRGHMAEAPVLVKDAVGERDSVADLVAQLRNRIGLAYSL